MTRACVRAFPLCSFPDTREPVLSTSSSSTGIGIVGSALTYDELITRWGFDTPTDDGTNGGEVCVKGR